MKYRSMSFTYHLIDRSSSGRRRGRCPLVNLSYLPLDKRWCACNLCRTIFRHGIREFHRADCGDRIMVDQLLNKHFQIMGNIIPSLLDQ